MMGGNLLVSGVGYVWQVGGLNLEVISGWCGGVDVVNVVDVVFALERCMCWLGWVVLAVAINGRSILRRVVVLVSCVGCRRINCSCVEVGLEVGRWLNRLVCCGLLLQ